MSRILLRPTRKSKLCRTPNYGRRKPSRQRERRQSSLRIEGYATERTRGAVDAGVEQLAEIGRLDEHVAVPDAMHGDREEEHRKRRYDLQNGREESTTGGRERPPGNEDSSYGTYGSGMKKMS